MSKTKPITLLELVPLSLIFIFFMDTQNIKMVAKERIVKSLIMISLFIFMYILAYFFDLDKITILVISLVVWWIQLYIRRHGLST